MRKNMHRRRYLSLAGIGGVASISGCANQINQALRSPETPAGMTVETASWPSGFITTDDREWPYAVVVTSRDQAADNLAIGETAYDNDPSAFVDQTDFDQSYLILIEYAPASGTDSLELKRIERRDHGIHVTAKVYEPNGSDDVTTHSLFIRVTDETDDPPQDMTVEVIDQANE